MKHTKTDNTNADCGNAFANCNSLNCYFILGSYGKYTTKLKNWKVPRFLRKHSDTPLHEMKKQVLTDKTIQFLERGDVSAGFQSSNGYQQVPIVIESQDNKNRPAQSSSKVNLPQSQDIASFEREIIDIRSYLSQSRSNMSPFARSSSYRSQYGRPNCEVMTLIRLTLTYFAYFTHFPSWNSKRLQNINCDTLIHLN